MMLDITGKRSWFFIISGVVILIGIVSLVSFGLKPGIDFSSGSIMTLSFEQDEVADRKPDQVHHAIPSHSQRSRQIEQDRIYPGVYPDCCSCFAWSTAC